MRAGREHSGNKSRSASLIFTEPLHARTYAKRAHTMPGRCIVTARMRTRMRIHARDGVMIYLEQDRCYTEPTDRVLVTFIGATTMTRFTRNLLPSTIVVSRDDAWPGTGDLIKYLLMYFAD